jgi:hypothetical protein
LIFFTSRLACARRVARLTLANDMEGDEDISGAWPVPAATAQTRYDQTIPSSVFLARNKTNPVA